MAVEVGIDPALIDRAARLIPRHRAESLFERLIGGPIKHRNEAQLPTRLTEARSTHLLSAVRAHVDKQGEGQADAAGMSWYSEPDGSRISVTAHAEGDGTRVRVAVDRRLAFGTLAFLSMAFCSVTRSRRLFFSRFCSTEWRSSPKKISSAQHPT